MTKSQISGSAIRLVLGTMTWALAAGIASGQPSAQMAKDATPSFEVATIKLSDPGATDRGFRTRGHRVIVKRQTLMSMVTFAYAVHQQQIMGGPTWIGSEAYDIDGIADVEGEPDLRQMQVMLQKLLVERFGLQFHREQRDLARYTLEVVKGGPKLMKSAAKPDSQPGWTIDGNAKQALMRFTNSSMKDLTLGMQSFLDKPVVDGTGLTGRFDFALQWTPDDLKTSEENGPPGLFTAIREELGLKLEAAKGPVEVLAIQHVQRPSAN